jgi:ABC-2 type transport system ATP-binding protein
MIQVRNLTKKYGDFTAVDNISFRVEKGRILGFLGPNGAGKTTTMRVLTGYMPATSGEITMAGYDIFKQPMEARWRIGYLPEHPPLYNDLTVRDYLLFVAKIKGVEKKRYGERIDAVVDQCGLEEVREARIEVLSKGFRQRVGLAQALIHEPDVLVLDEPTIGLDPNQIKEIREMIRDLAGTHTIILSTHILPEVTMTCDEAIIIHKGRVVAADTLDNLTKRLQTENRLFLRLAKPDEGALRLIRETPGVAEVARGEEPGSYRITGAANVDPSSDLGMLVLQRGWGLRELRREQPSLEEIFVHLTSE